MPAVPAGFQVYTKQSDVVEVALGLSWTRIVTGPNKLSNKNVRECLEMSRSCGAQSFRKTGNGSKLGKPVIGHLASSSIEDPVVEPFCQLPFL